MHGERKLLRGTSGQMDSLHHLMKSNDSLWPEGRQVRAIKKIQAFGHMCVQRCANGGNDRMVQVRRCLCFS